jgi:hypothetical protein
MRSSIPVSGDVQKVSDSRFAPNDGGPATFTKNLSRLNVIRRLAFSMLLPDHNLSRLAVEA